MISTLATVLRHYGKVFPLKPAPRANHEALAVLVTNQKYAGGNGTWRPNRNDVLVAGNSDTAFSHCFSYLEAMKRSMSGPHLTSGLDVALPVFGRGDGRIIQAGKRLLQANEIDTFTTWENYGGVARQYVASVSEGRLLCDADGLYGEQELNQIDWTKHGLIFVSPGQYPLSLSLSLRL